MKKLISFLVLVCLLIGLAVPAYADTLDEGEESVSGTVELQDPAPGHTSPTVTTLEELQAAINAVEGGDTIAIAQEISLTVQSLETDKNIIITRADGFTSPMFYMDSGSTINGFSFLENDSGGETISVGLFADGVSIKNCFFDNEVGHSRPYISIGGGTVNVKVDKCSFSRNNDSALDARANTFIEADNCTFKNNSAGMQGGAINSAGTISLNNCTITDNAATSGGGVFCSGELVVFGCQFGGNKITAENAGADIFCTGKLSINDEMVGAAGYYEMTTGEKIMLPLENLTSIAKLAYFTTAEAEDYFKPINPTPTPDPEPEPGEGDNSSEEPPIIPPVDNEDNQDSPQMPQQPSESDNDGGDGQSPAVPQTPTEAIVAPTAGLVCSDAVIDTSRSVVLEGYGDGFLHEDDPLTREQLATIIYRLLDEAILRRPLLHIVLSIAAPFPSPHLLRDSPLLYWFLH